MKWLRVLLILVVSVQCSFGQTQSEMNSEAEAEYAKAQTEMNRVYQQILKDYGDDDVFISKLKTSQNLWVQFRDAEFNMKFPVEDTYEYYGSMYPMCSAYYLTSLTNERTKKLREWIENPKSDDGCSGSVMFRN